MIKLDGIGVSFLSALASGKGRLIRKRRSGINPSYSNRRLMLIHCSLIFLCCFWEVPVNAQMAMPEDEERLYLWDIHNLYLLNPQSGIATTIFDYNRSDYFFRSYDSSIAIDGDDIYITSELSEALHKMEIDTNGITTSRVGDVTSFGVPEYEDLHLAFHNKILYMTGGVNNALYTLNTNTGVATRVGVSESFGLSGEIEITGLHSINENLWLSLRNRIFKINTENGEVINSSLIDFPCCGSYISEMLFHNNNVYVVSGSSLLLLDEKRNQLSTIGLLKNLHYRIPVSIYKDNIFYIGTDNALHKMDIESKVSSRVSSVDRFGSRIEVSGPKLFTLKNLPSGLPPIQSAILPNARSVQIGNEATVFATAINGGKHRRTHCEIRLDNAPDGLEFRYFLADEQNHIVGEENEKVVLGSGESQFYVIAITSQNAIEPTEIFPVFACADDTPSNKISGVNSLTFSATVMPTLDILASVSTPPRDGNNDGVLRGSSGKMVAFALASSNVGGSGQVRVNIRGTGDANTLEMLICQTDMTTGACLDGLPEEQAIANLGAGEVSTWAVFVEANEPVAFNPAESRIMVEFFDDDDVRRGATSVAVSFDASAEAN